MHNAEKIIFAAGSVLAVSAPAYFIFEDDWSYDFHAFFHGVLGYLERDGVGRDHSVQASFIILMLLKYLLVLEMMILGAFYEDLNYFRRTDLPPLRREARRGLSRYWYT